MNFIKKMLKFLIKCLVLFTISIRKLFLFIGILPQMFLKFFFYYYGLLYSSSLTFIKKFVSFRKISNVCSFLEAKSLLPLYRSSQGLPIDPIKLYLKKNRYFVIVLSFLLRINFFTFPFQIWSEKIVASRKKKEKLFLDVFDTRKIDKLSENKIYKKTFADFLKNNEKEQEIYRYKNQGKGFDLNPPKDIFFYPKDNLKDKPLDYKSKVSEYHASLISKGVEIRMRTKKLRKYHEFKEELSLTGGSLKDVSVLKAGRFVDERIERKLQNLSYLSNIKNLQDFREKVGFLNFSLFLKERKKSIDDGEWEDIPYTTDFVFNPFVLSLYVLYGLFELFVIIYTVGYCFGTPFQLISFFFTYPEVFHYLNFNEFPSPISMALLFTFYSFVIAIFFFHTLHILNDEDNRDSNFHLSWVFTLLVVNGEALLIFVFFGLIFFDVLVYLDFFFSRFLFYPFFEHPLNFLFVLFSNVIYVLAVSDVSLDSLFETGSFFNNYFNIIEPIYMREILPNKNNWALVQPENLANPLLARPNLFLLIGDFIDNKMFSNNNFVDLLQAERDFWKHELFQDIRKYNFLRKNWEDLLLTGQYHSRGFNGKNLRLDFQTYLPQIKPINKMQYFGWRVHVRGLSALDRNVPFFPGFLTSKESSIFDLSALVNFDFIELFNQWWGDGESFKIVKPSMSIQSYSLLSQEDFNLSMILKKDPLTQYSYKYPEFSHDLFEWNSPIQKVFMDYPSQKIKVVFDGVFRRKSKFYASQFLENNNEQYFYRFFNQYYGDIKRTSTELEYWPITLYNYYWSDEAPLYYFTQKLAEFQMYYTKRMRDFYKSKPYSYSLAQSLSIMDFLDYYLTISTEPDKETNILNKFLEGHKDKVIDDSNLEVVKGGVGRWLKEADGLVIPRETYEKNKYKAFFIPTVNKDESVVASNLEQKLKEIEKKKVIVEPEEEEEYESNSDTGSTYFHKFFHTVFDLISSRESKYFGYTDTDTHFRKNLYYKFLRVFKPNFSLSNYNSYYHNNNRNTKMWDFPGFWSTLSKTQVHYLRDNYIPSNAKLDNPQTNFYENIKLKQFGACLHLDTQIQHWLNFTNVFWNNYFHFYYKRTITSELNYYIFRLADFNNKDKKAMSYKIFIGQKSLQKSRIGQYIFNYMDWNSYKKNWLTSPLQTYKRLDKERFVYFHNKENLLKASRVKFFQQNFFYYLFDYYNFANIKKNIHFYFSKLLNIKLNILFSVSKEKKYFDNMNLLKINILKKLVPNDSNILNIKRDNKSFLEFFFNLKVKQEKVFTDDDILFSKSKTKNKEVFQNFFHPTFNNIDFLFMSNIIRNSNNECLYEQKDVLIQLVRDNFMLKNFSNFSRGFNSSTTKRKLFKTGFYQIFNILKNHAEQCFFINTNAVRKGFYKKMNLRPEHKGRELRFLNFAAFKFRHRAMTTRFLCKILFSTNGFFNKYQKGTVNTFSLYNFDVITRPFLFKKNRFLLINTFDNQKSLSKIYKQGFLGFFNPTFFRTSKLSINPMKTKYHLNLEREFFFGQFREIFNNINKKEVLNDEYFFVKKFKIFNPLILHWTNILFNASNYNVLYKTISSYDKSQLINKRLKNLRNMQNFYGLTFDKQYVSLKKQAYTQEIFSRVFLLTKKECQVKLIPHVNLEFAVEYLFDNQRFLNTKFNRKLLKEMEELYDFKIKMKKFTFPKIKPEDLNLKEEFKDKFRFNLENLKKFLSLKKNQKFIDNKNNFLKLFLENNYLFEKRDFSMDGLFDPSISSELDFDEEIITLDLANNFYNADRKFGNFFENETERGITDASASNKKIRLGGTNRSPLDEFSILKNNFFWKSSRRRRYFEVLYLMGEFSKQNIPIREVKKLRMQYGWQDFVVRFPHIGRGEVIRAFEKFMLGKKWHLLESWTNIINEDILLELDKKNLKLKYKKLLKYISSLKIDNIADLKNKYYLQTQMKAEEQRFKKYQLLLSDVQNLQKKNSINISQASQLRRYNRYIKFLNEVHYRDFFEWFYENFVFNKAKKISFKTFDFIFMPMLGRFYFRYLLWSNKINVFCKLKSNFLVLDLMSQTFEHESSKLFWQFLLTKNIRLGILVKNIDLKNNLLSNSLTGFSHGDLGLFYKNENFKYNIFMSNQFSNMKAYERLNNLIFFFDKFNNIKTKKLKIFFNFNEKNSLFNFVETINRVLDFKLSTNKYNRFNFSDQYISNFNNIKLNLLDNISFVNRNGKYNTVFNQNRCHIFNLLDLERYQRVHHVKRFRPMSRYKYRIKNFLEITGDYRDLLDGRRSTKMKLRSFIEDNTNSKTMNEHKRWFVNNLQRNPTYNLGLLDATLGHGERDSRNITVPMIKYMQAQLRDMSYRYGSFTSSNKMLREKYKFSRMDSFVKMKQTPGDTMAIAGDIDDFNESTWKELRRTRLFVPFDKSPWFFANPRLSFEVNKEFISLYNRNQVEEFKEIFFQSIKILKKKILLDIVNLKLLEIKHDVLYNYNLNLHVDQTYLKLRKEPKLTFYQLIGSLFSIKSKSDFDNWLTWGGIYFHSVFLTTKYLIEYFFFNWEITSRLNVLEICLTSTKEFNFNLEKDFDKIESLGFFKAFFYLLFNYNFSNIFEYLGYCIIVVVVWFFHLYVKFIVLCYYLFYLLNMDDILFVFFNSALSKNYNTGELTFLHYWVSYLLSMDVINKASWLLQLNHLLFNFSFIYLFFWCFLFWFLIIKPIHRPTKPERFYHIDYENYFMGLKKQQYPIFPPFETVLSRHQKYSNIFLDLPSLNVEKMGSDDELLEELDEQIDLLYHHDKYLAKYLENMRQNLSDMYANNIVFVFPHEKGEYDIMRFRERDEESMKGRVIRTWLNKKKSDDLFENGVSFFVLPRAKKGKRKNILADSNMLDFKYQNIEKQDYYSFYDLFGSLYSFFDPKQSMVGTHFIMRFYRGCQSFFLFFLLSVFFCFFFIFLYVFFKWVLLWFF